jgi:hypothetical protein
MCDCTKTIDDIQHRMISGKTASSDSFAGCSEEEIATLENQCGIHFPEMYRTFLARMGRGAGDFFLGTEWKYPELKHLRSRAESLISATGTSYLLPQDAFVFAMHQGYALLFFYVTGDDPPVWSYVEYDTHPTEVSPSFSSWLRDTVEEHICSTAKSGDVGSGD